ncbi:MAG: hypothetical protein K2N73_05485 [Lachnospiraceae bacterium]|nr:hypothetical protein [Lachnospiraceae bacterium]
MEQYNKNIDGTFGIEETTIEEMIIEETVIDNPAIQDINLNDTEQLNKAKSGVKKSAGKRVIWAAGFFSLASAVIAAGTLILRKDIKINPMLAEKYSVHGVDVSHYQGVIDWEILAQQNLDFAVIKATEGSTHIDDRFEENWQSAEQTHLYLGAYHFFSFDSEGDKQAASYIETVGNLDGKLAPVIDVEYYGDKRSNPPERAEVVQNLGAMLDTLEQHYQIKPIIYTTFTVYNDYIKGEFEDYPLWVRSIYCPPAVLFGNKWSFWQYMDTAMLDGYAGDQKYIDVNVFRGTMEELEELVIQTTECREE